MTNVLSADGRGDAGAVDTREESAASAWREARAGWQRWPEDRERSSGVACIEVI